MVFESIDEALADLVRQLGGHKKVGPQLWPAKDPDAAGRLLADCLNAERPARLSPEKVMFLLRLGRQAGVDTAIGWMLKQLHYAPTRPISRQDELADLNRMLQQHQEGMAALIARMEDLMSHAGSTA